MKREPMAEDKLLVVWGAMGQWGNGGCCKLLECKCFVTEELRFHHFFLDSSMETPPGPSETTINRPPITDSVWKKSYLRKSLIGL